MAGEARACGPCSLCCTLLRVDALGKLGGTPCVHQRAGGGCGIHATRPAICRAYRCLWLEGGLAADERPDRLGAVVDLVTEGMQTRLLVRQARPGALASSPALRAVVERFRATLPVRITGVADVLDPDRGYRELRPDGEELRVAGDRVTRLRDGAVVSERRIPWLERWIRRLALRLGARRLRGMR